MSLNIIDLIKGQLGPALVSNAASKYGESESGVSKAIEGFLPAVLGGLSNNADNPLVLDAIMNSSSPDILGNLDENSLNNSSIASVLTQIFGDKINELVNSIAAYAGISNNSSSSLLHLVTGATVGSVSKYAVDNNLDKTGISNLLKDQQGIVSTLLPAGLSFASLSMGDWDARYKFDNDKDAINMPSEEEPKVEVTRSTTLNGTFPDRNKDREGSIWKWLLPLLLLIAAAYFIWRQCEQRETTTTTIVKDSGEVVMDTATTTVNDTATGMSSTQTDEDIDLNGTALRGYKGGMEDRMIAFLKSDGYKNAQNDNALKDTWYNFDHVNFKTGSADQLEAGSEGQLQNLTAILRAYPDAKIKIGGYTDKTGDETGNKKLSDERAKFISSWLKKQGVGSQIMGAEGYGSQFATVDASASDADRAVDRKMAVRFAK
ncbi:OmpA family protein [Chryseobacterium sp. CCH4-E10]|uniref:OmpA family protein n=1 Tax=Chryseobacterium sp. CCH4-E10 TaxID=1768758 RepID=UPI00082E7460|nr:OmpA family protein [Chryseobacterium sp. CCH4-E10]